MALPLANNQEGGSAGTTLTGGSGGNTGGASGDFLDFITIGAGATNTFDATNPAHGTGLGFKIVTTSPVTATYVTWSTSLGTLGTNQTLYGRFYYHQPDATAPASSVRLIQILNGSTLLAGISHSSGTGKLAIRDAAGAIAGTESGTAVPQTTVVRVEWQLTGIGGGAGVGTGLARWYTGDSTTPGTTDATTTTAANFGSLAPDTFRLGITTANATTLASYYFDALQVNATGFPGPEDTGPPWPPAGAGPPLWVNQSNCRLG